MQREPDPQNRTQPQAVLGLADAYAELQNLLLDGSDVTDFLQQLATLASALVPNTACGVTTRRDRQVLTAGSSDDFALRLDEVQYHRGQGPCLHALHSGDAVEITDLVTDDRWPEYRIAALAHGVGSSYSLPLTLDDTTVGAVNLYSRTPHAFTDTAKHQLELFTRQAAVALTLLLRHAQHVTLDAELQEALTARSVIDQALGIVMGQQRVTSNDAFALLREPSQNSNRRLVDVAADLISGVTGQPPQPPRPFIRRP
jgi:GAF domain-containing protein